MAVLLAGTGLVLGQAPASYEWNGTSQATYYQSTPGALPAAAPGKHMVQYEGAAPNGAKPPSDVGQLPPGPGGSCGPYGCDAPGCTACSPTCDWWACPRCPGANVYGSGEFLLWNVENSRLPDFLFVVPVGVISVDVFTISLDPNTLQPLPSPPNPVIVTEGFLPLMIDVNSTLPRDSAMDLGEHLGARFTVGYWLDNNREVAVEGRFAYLNSRSQSFLSTSGMGQGQFVIDTGFDNEFVTITQPDVFTPAQVEVVRTEDIVVVREADNTVNGTFTEGPLHLAELNLLATGGYYGPVKFDGILGVRYAGYEESLEVRDNIRIFLPEEVDPVPADSSFPTLLRFDTFDSVSAENYFFGAQIGGTFEWECGSLFLSGSARVAAGANRQEVSVENQIVSIEFDEQSGTEVRIMNGGLLTGPGDVGKHVRYRFATVSELNLKLGFWACPCARCWIGYDYLYFQNFARVNQQFARSTSTTTLEIGSATAGEATTGDAATQTLTATQPVLYQTDEDLWIQGVNFGIEFLY